MPAFFFNTTFQVIGTQLRRAVGSAVVFDDNLKIVHQVFVLKYKGIQTLVYDFINGKYYG